MGADATTNRGPSFGVRGLRDQAHGRLTRLLWIGVWLAGATWVEAAEVQFNRDIRPILSEHCFRCHGPDESTREAGLRLDVHAAAIVEREGKRAIAPGKPDQSLLLQRVTSPDDDLRMPPPETGKRLSEEQIQLLRTWIEGGATYQQHWSFEPVKRPRVPAVQAAEWTRNPIDRFILKALEQHGLRPSAEADRATLIRRLYLDLLGLPPSVGDVTTFLQDDQPDAYERLVDRVLASPRFGERWGRHWLDQARYADSHGYTNDNERVMWPFRDWVITALNRDLPFDLFTIEQLAGDLLSETPEAARPLASEPLDALIATGFHRNTLINTEGGTKADQFRDEQVKDRVDTTGGVWLGLTVGCAKCHTHKYDPISQHEYYQLYSFFNSTTDNNSIPPTVKAPTFMQRQREQELQRKRVELESYIENHPGRQQRREAWEAALAARPAARANSSSESAQGEPEDRWTVLKLDGKSRAGARLTPQPDLSLLASGANEGGDEYQITALAPMTKIRSVRLETLTDPSLPEQGPGRAPNGNFVVSEIWFRTGDGRELRFSKATADHSQKNYEVSGAIDNNASTGWAVNGSSDGVLNQKRTAWFILPQPLEVELGHALTFTLQFNAGANAYNLGRLRLSVLAEEWVDVASEKELIKLAAVSPSERSQDQQRRLEEGFLRQDAALAAAFAELQLVKQRLEQLSAEVPSTMVMEELSTPRPTHLQIRGDFLRLGEALEANVPQILPPLRSAAADPLKAASQATASQAAASQAAASQAAASQAAASQAAASQAAASQAAASQAAASQAAASQAAASQAAASQAAASQAAASQAAAGSHANTTAVGNETASNDSAQRVAAELTADAEPAQATSASTPATPVSASGTPTSSGRSAPAPRLQFARWLVRADHPLTPRVQVNRVWMRLFGVGLVETENDFGTQGALPTHPELLDWLAAEFIEREWSTKQLLRCVVTSATYRQSSALPAPDAPAEAREAAERAAERDPLNRWLWRQNRVRVEAEVLRDLGLAASGLLSHKLGGPSVFPPQPAGVYAFTQRVQNWRTSQGEDRYRRGMYTFFFRSAPYPMLSTFDVPNFNQTCTKRDRSNTPLQALTVANDETMVEMTRALAERPKRDLPTDATQTARLAYLFQLAVARPPSDAEMKVLELFWEQQRQAFASSAEAAKQVTGGATDQEQAAWVATARVVLNLDEFITRE